MKDTEGALKWIVGILEKHKIPFRISGGFAARIYGSDRELADIDIGMDKNYIPELLPEIKEYVVHGPQIYKDDEWDLFLVTLNYKGQEIDLYPIDSLKLFNKKTGQWENVKHTFQDLFYIEIYNIKVPLISKKNLIEYKSKIAREVDLIDVNNMLKVK